MHTDLFSHDTPEDSSISVCLPVAVDRCFDYVVPPNMHVAPGSYVRVPFSNRQVTGIVWGEGQGDIDPGKLKPIECVLPHLLPMTEALRRFIEGTARYNATSLGAALKLAMPAMDALLEPESEIWVESMKPVPDMRMTVSRKRVLDWLQEEGALPQEVLRDRGISLSVLKGMRDEGAIQMVSRLPDYVSPLLQPCAPTLSDLQRQAAQHMCAAIGQGFHTFLLDGATGSGKTEVFLEVAEAVMREGRQVLLLVPEIALSMQLVERVQKRFGIAPTVWHSSETPARRRQALRQIMHGGTSLVIGARSALFLPYADLGLIVVDEEHDSSYKQEDGVRYHARDMAVLRGREEQIPVVLTSATPSLESWVNANQGKYGHVHIQRRVEQARLPQVTLIDMRRQAMDKQCWLSPMLREALTKTLEQGRQSLLFLNRRGYAPLMICQECGHRYECPSCSAWLVYHASSRQLQCHHCGLAMPVPSACVSCGAGRDKIVACGPGVERIEEEVRALFPQARSVVLSGELSQSPARLQETLTQVTEGEIDIIIGTQLLAKGHHFPALATVGVVDADAGLQGGDIRGAEKTYQLLHQLSGRAGRESERGEVYIQTYRPAHPLMEALTEWDRQRFMELELEQRRMTGMPPYGRLAALIVEGKPEALVEEVVGALVRRTPNLEGVAVFGPAPAPLYKLKNLYRQRFLVKASKQTALQPVMLQWRDSIKRPATVSVSIDIDPISFM